MPGRSSWIQRCTVKIFTRTVFAKGKGKAISFLPDEGREALWWAHTQQGDSLWTPLEPPLPSSRAIPKTQIKGASKLSTPCLWKLFLLAWINKRFIGPEKEVARRLSSSWFSWEGRILRLSSSSKGSYCVSDCDKPIELVWNAAGTFLHECPEK